MQAVQLLLFDEKPTQAGPITLEMPYTWADGDHSQAALERLAAILLRPGLRGDSCKDDQGNVYLFKITATRVDTEAGCVVGSLVEDVELERTLGVLRKRGLSEQSEVDDEC